MKETEYIREYVEFLKAKRVLRENLRAALAQVELEFIEVQAKAIESGIEVRSVQKAVNELHKLQNDNRKIEQQDSEKMKELLEEFKNES